MTDDAANAADAGAIVAGAAVRLAAPELMPILDELARRYGDGDAPRTITLRTAPEATLRAVADLLGLDRLPRAGTRLSIDRLAGALGLGAAEGLRAAVEKSRGPMPDRRAARLADRDAREELWAWLAASAGEVPIGNLSSWVTAVRAAGIRGGITAHRRRLTAALSVLHALPAEDVPLAALASDCTGDPHALDARRSLTMLVLDAIAVATGADRATDAEAARGLWERMGVVPDPLSSTVLTLGLAGRADEPSGAWLSAAAAACEPVLLTLSQLRRWPVPALPVDATAYVVENPSLIATAAARGWTGPPLLCSSGRPTMAVVALVRQLAADGAVIRQHADFDPAGLDITRWLAERADTAPWRMSSADYLRGVQLSEAPVPITGRVPATPWDPSLADEMRAAKVCVYEEALREALLHAMTPRI